MPTEVDMEEVSALMTTEVVLGEGMAGALARCRAGFGAIDAYDYSFYQGSDTDIEEYKDFARLQVAGVNDLVLPSSSGADRVWHEHILRTRDYELFCKRAYGFFKHHDPTSAPAADVLRASVRFQDLREWLYSFSHSVRGYFNLTSAPFAAQVPDQLEQPQPPPVEAASKAQAEAKVSERRDAKRAREENAENVAKRAKPDEEYGEEDDEEQGCCG